MKPQFPELTRAIRGLAPATLAAHHASGARLLRVWDGASSGTIWGDARNNHAFRAWHDSHHISGQFSFTREGEAAACEYQIAQLYVAFPGAPKSWAAVIRAEVIGQADYFVAFGRFPTDQLAFFRDYLTNGKA